MIPHGAGTPADAGGDGTPNGAAAPRGRTGLYYFAFVALALSAVALGAGGIALFGGAPLGFLWASVALSLLAAVLAIAAVFVRRRR